MSEPKRKGAGGAKHAREASPSPAAFADKAGPRTSRLRRDGVQGERVSVYLPPELVVRLRVFCAKERRSISDAVTEAVAGYLPPER